MEAVEATEAEEEGQDVVGSVAEKYLRKSL